MMITTCDSCGAEIIFANSGSTGKPMPIDAEPVAAGGNIRLEERDRPLPPLAHVVGATIDMLTDDDGTRYRSHFVTCPNADEWRSRGRPMSAERLATPGPKKYRTMRR